MTHCTDCVSWNGDGYTYDVTDAHLVTCACGWEACVWMSEDCDECPECGQLWEPRQCPVCLDRVNDGLAEGEMCAACSTTCAGCGERRDLVVGVQWSEEYCAECWARGKDRAA